MSKLDEIRKRLKDAGVGSLRNSSGSVASHDLSEGRQIRRDAPESRIATPTLERKPTNATVTNHLVSSENSLSLDRPEQAGSSAAIAQISNADHMRTTPRPECKALCIGMNEYCHIGKLENATRDARDMALVMSLLGFEVTSIFDRDYDDTFTSLNYFKSTIKPGDEVVLTFAGHGGSINSEPYLYPIDVRDCFKGINLYKDFIDPIEGIGAKVAIAIIDACRPQTRVNVDESSVPQSDQEDFEIDHELEQAILQMFQQLEDIGNRNAQRIRKNPKSSDKEIFGFGIVYATSHNSYAGDGSDLTNGLFTHFFKQEVLKPGLNITEVFSRVRQQVVEATNGDQRPAFHDELSGTYSFLPSNVLERGQ